MKLALLSACLLFAIFVGVALLPGAPGTASALPRVTSTDVTPGTPGTPVVYPTDTPLPIGYLPPSEGPYPAPVGAQRAPAPVRWYFPFVR